MTGCPFIEKIVCKYTSLCVHTVFSNSTTAEWQGCKAVEQHASEEAFSLQSLGSGSAFFIGSFSRTELFSVSAVNTQERSAALRASWTTMKPRRTSLLNQSSTKAATLPIQRHPDLRRAPARPILRLLEK
jgi:hypothetical protein